MTDGSGYFHSDGVRTKTIMMMKLVKTGTMMEACRQLLNDDMLVGHGEDDGDEEGNDEEGNDEDDADDEGNDEGLWLFDRPFPLWCIN